MHRQPSERPLENLNVAEGRRGGLAKVRSETRVETFRDENNERKRERAERESWTRGRVRTFAETKHTRIIKIARGVSCTPEERKIIALSVVTLCLCLRKHPTPRISQSARGRRTKGSACGETRNIFAVLNQPLRRLKSNGKHRVALSLALALARAPRAT